MNISRRDLFTNWFDTISENFEGITKNVLPIFKEVSTNSNNKKYFNVGLLNDFPPKSIKEIEVNNKQYIILSNEEGLYCIDKHSFENNMKEPRYFLKIENNGEIVLNPYEFLPKGKILSVITNEFIDEKEV